MYSTCGETWGQTGRSRIILPELELWSSEAGKTFRLSRGSGVLSIPRHAMTASATKPIGVHRPKFLHRAEFCEACRKVFPREGER
jgi:hypothetical protein